MLHQSFVFGGSIIHFDANPVINPLLTTTEMSLPNTERDLQVHLGERYVDSDWRPALEAVINVEEDMETASNAIDALIEFGFPHAQLHQWVGFYYRVLECSVVVCSVP
ncbi:hypothetical protein AZE42_12441 [Rhizopogon vesiculosus]|uniref:Uncharacterized protein n=1 Tax=Rhizopogon vesiculosus TaxID=180088 RepID=A0A1J8Q137_9AGAM|nr:hypothetical protein AZE42_12441 [Rhizopogon vesiculosus]